MYFSFLSLLQPHLHWSCDHLLTYIVLIFSHIYDDDVCFFTYLYMCLFFSLFIHIFLYVCNLYFCFTHDALIRAVQIDLVTRPTRRTDWTRPESDRPDCFGESVAGLHHQKPIPAGRFRISSSKTRKTQTDQKISRFRQKFLDPDQNFQNPAIIFQNPAKKPKFRRYFPQIQ